jgi:hypothetical protein
MIGILDFIICTDILRRDHESLDVRRVVVKYIQVKKIKE